MAERIEGEFYVAEKVAGVPGRYRIVRADGILVPQVAPSTREEAVRLLGMLNDCARHHREAALAEVDAAAENLGEFEAANESPIMPDEPWAIFANDGDGEDEVGRGKTFTAALLSDGEAR